MSREGNTRCFGMFPDDANFLNPLCPIHRRVSVSREDVRLNYDDGHAAHTTSITIENCAASMFNKNAKEFQDTIVNNVRVLLKHHEEMKTIGFCVSTRIASNT